MAYTTIDKPTDYFNTKLWTGNGSTQAITGNNYQPDLVWIKRRSGVGSNYLFNSINGANKALISDNANSEYTLSGYLNSFDSDGFTVGNDGAVNGSGDTYVGWNWLAGGTAPAITYTVKVVSDSGNKYRFDDFGTSAVTLDLQEGGTYTFDQSDSSNSGHPLRFSTTSDGTHGGGSEYTTNVTTTGTPGSAGAKTVITVASSAPTLYYYCSVHSGMGGQANTNSTFGSSNFGGSIQANVSANTTAGFSIVSYTGNGSAGATVGHGLGAVPKMFIVKRRNSTGGWVVYHEDVGNTKIIELHDTAASQTSSAAWNNTSPSSSTFTLGDYTSTNTSGGTYIAYCFAEKKGYSKFGSYTGNGNADGTFIYTGFKPAFLIVKRTDAADGWIMFDNKRSSFNVVDKNVQANSSNSETDFDYLDFTSNGFKTRMNGASANGSGMSYIYMAFAESPFVTSTGIPTCAR